MSDLRPFGFTMLGISTVAAISAVWFAIVNAQPWFAVIMLSIDFCVALAWACVFAFDYYEPVERLRSKVTPSAKNTEGENLDDQRIASLIDARLRRLLPLEPYGDPSRHQEFRLIVAGVESDGGEPSMLAGRQHVVNGGFQGSTGFIADSRSDDISAVHETPRHDSSPSSVGPGLPTVVTTVDGGLPGRESEHSASRTTNSRLPG